LVVGASVAVLYKKKSKPKNIAHNQKLQLNFFA
jgi:hypothetical protein